MKKLLKHFSLIAAFLAIAFSAEAQDPWYDYIGGDSRDVHNFTCMTGSVFDQIPTDYNIGVYCDASYTVTKVADDYTATSSFSQMRVWGVYDVKPVETFLIEFYDGPPDAIGTSVIHTFNVSTNPIPTPYLRNGSVIHEINIDFGTSITQLTGWVSISRTTLPYVSEFAWIGNSSGGNSKSYFIGGSTWQSNTVDQFFCFGGTPPIPVSNWAIILGVLLIGTFIVVRYRTRLA